MDFSNFNKVKGLKVIEDLIIDDDIPQKNIILDEIVLGRKEIELIPVKKWQEIQDKKLPTAYMKKNAVKSYFSTCIYLLKRIKSLSILEGQSYRKAVEVSHTSSYRTSQNTSFRIENNIEASATCDVFSLRESLTLSYGIDKLKEYASEKRKTTSEEVNYESSTNSRNIVFWDLVKLIVIYREDLRGDVTMMAYNDFYVETRQKAYM